MRIYMYVLFVEFCVCFSQIKRCLYFSARSAITEAAEGMELSSRNVYRVNDTRTQQTYLVKFMKWFLRPIHNGRLVTTKLNA